MTGGDIRDGGYVLEFLLRRCVQSVCIESVFHREHYNYDDKIMMMMIILVVVMVMMIKRLVNWLLY